MSKRFLLFLWAVCGTAYLSAVSAAGSDKPDFLLIMVDDLRPALGCYGDTQIRTPNIDRLAERGVVFERAYCQYAKCGTSRLSMLTGMRPVSIGIYSNNVRDVERFRRRNKDVRSFPRTLKQHGWHTRSFGKIYHDGWDDPDDWSEPSFPGRDREMWEVVSEDNPSGPTLIAERWSCPVIQQPDVADSHLFAGRMTDRLIQTIQSDSRTAARCLAVGYRRPHLPFIAPKRYFDLYDPNTIPTAKNPLPPDGSPVMAWFNSDGYVGSAKRIGLTMPLRPSRRDAVSWNGYEMRSYLGVPPQGPISDRLQRQLKHAYAACVSYVDAQIGRLLNAVRSSPQGNRTVVILCSDHGWHLGEHSAWGKMTNFEIATRVPLIVAGPGIDPGRSQTIVELVDLYPTICDIAGIPKPDHLAGSSIADILKDPGRTNADSVAVSRYSRFRDRFTGLALRTQNFRYVRWTDVESGKVVHRELYDQRKDPDETKNAAANPEYAAVVRQLESRLSDVVRRQSF